jgi:FixJ family two-component response regulator
VGSGGNTVGGDRRPALVVHDAAGEELPGQAGLDVLESLSGDAECPVIILGGSSDAALVDVIHRLGMRWAHLRGDDG